MLAMLQSFFNTFFSTESTYHDLVHADDDEEEEDHCVGVGQGPGVHPVKTSLLLLAPLCCLRFMDRIKQGSGITWFTRSGCARVQ